MTRYWAIAPFESKNSEIFDRIWQFDLAQNVISIGWGEIGDVSRMSYEALVDKVVTTYPDKPNSTKSLFVNMLWAFYHEISSGDVILARKGRKILVAIGKVIKEGFYEPGKNPHNSHPNFLGVKWLDQPRNKVFENIVFP